VSIATQQKQLNKLEREQLQRAPRSNPDLDRLRADPTFPFKAMGWHPDPWQVSFLSSAAKRESLLCSRRAGKTTATAARVMREACIQPKTDALIFSPTLRQSMELLRMVREFYLACGKPVPAIGETKTVLELANGSRVISLPDNHEGVVGVGNPRLVVIDEGSRVSEELYKSVRPMLAVTNGQLLTLSTPFGNAGWFFDIWDESSEAANRHRRLHEQWRKTPVPASAVPRITQDFLDDERIELGQRWFDQEYNLRFLDSIDAVFSQAVIHGARAEDVQPLFELGA
jgi:hypothetical protein